MINNTLSNIAKNHASYSIITPSTTKIIEISMVNANIPAIIINTGINHCRTAVTTITTTVVVTISTINMIAIYTIMIIITSTGLLLLLFLLFINLSMSTNPIVTTIIVSMIATFCVNSSGRSIVLQQILLFFWLVSILSSLQIIVVRTRTVLGIMLLTVLLLPSILFTSIRFSTIDFTSTISTTIMITVIITTISISVAVTITLSKYYCSCSYYD